MSIPQYNLSGSNYEIGFQHGQFARNGIRNSLELYRKYFKEQAKLEWYEVRLLAGEFAISIERHHSDLYEEMRGIAEGSLSEIVDIVALNVRSEIGLVTPAAEPIDGCTSLGIRDRSGVQWSAQNWDWKSAATSSLIAVDIAAHEDRPRIKMMTEAGVIGKIGVNEFGVSVMLNALKTNLRNSNYIPIHLLLRRLLEQRSVDTALDYLENEIRRCASAAHVLLTDSMKSVSIEILPTGCHVQEPLSTSSSSCSSSSSKSNTGNQTEEQIGCGLGWICHSNHLVWTQESSETLAWPDSIPRLKIVSELVSSFSLLTSTLRGEDRMEEEEEGGFETIRREILSDRTLGEKSICRDESDEQGGIVTVFSIVVRHSRAKMKEGGSGVKAEIKIGRPDRDGEIITFEFS